MEASAPIRVVLRKNAKAELIATIIIMHLDLIISVLDYMKSYISYGMTS